MWQTLPVAPLQSCSNTTFSRAPARIARTIFIVLLLSAPGCVVPELAELEEERARGCDAQHACAAEYDCVLGECRARVSAPGCSTAQPCAPGHECVSGECRQLPADGSCTAGSKVSCDVASPCFRGERTCGEDGQFGVCVELPRPFWEEVEQSCDGLDNDCDGRIDVVSDRFALVPAGAASGGRSWIQVDGSFLTYTSDTRDGPSSVYFQRYTSELDPVGKELVLTIDGAAFSGHVSAGAAGTSGFVAFADDLLDGDRRVVALRVDGAGNFTWPDSGTGAARGFTYPGSNHDPVQSTRLAITGDQQAVMVLSRFGVEKVYGDVFGASDGALVTPNPVMIVAAGASEELLDTAAFGRNSTFVVAWASKTGAKYKVQLAELTKTLDFVGTSIRSFDVPGPVSSLTLVRSTGTNGFALYWIEELSPGQFAIATVQEPLNQASSTRVVGPTPERLASLQAAYIAGGPLLVWRQGDVDAKIQLRLPGGTTTPVTPPGVVPASGPSLALDPVNNRYWVTWEAAQGASLYQYRTQACGT